MGVISANKRVQFGGICLADGPLGVHMADLASVFPAGITTAATWDKELMYLRGKAMGAEFRGKGAHVMTGFVSCFSPQTEQY